MRANAKVEAEVLAVLQRYAEAYTRRDLAGILALFAPDPDLVLIGTGAGFFGKHVILASRVAGEARGGQILVSSLLKELTESGGDVRFGESREVELKGLAGSHRLFEAMWTAS